MSTLKSYSCSKCGGILNVDRDQDVLDCPFCGAKIDYIDFHSEDLLTQADYCLFRKDYKAAEEKYNTVLSYEPDNFLVLRGLAFCAGSINSEKILDEPVNLSHCFYNGIIRLLGEDRYRLSPYAEYFAKLSEVISKAQEYNRFNREKNSLQLTLISAPNKDDISRKLDEAQQSLKVAEEDYAKLYAELKVLEPDVESVSVEEPKMAFGSVTPSYGLLRIGCAKCGGTLSFDKERKLYTCNHCGIAYGYSLFYGDPMQKAMAELKSGDYETADQRFSHILMFDQHNFEALRGRILCAGKWKAFTQIRLSEDLMKVDWQLVRQRVDEFHKYVIYPNEHLCNLIDKLMKLLKEYSDILVMMQIEPNNEEYPQKKQVIIKKYPTLLRRLMYIDRVHHGVSFDHTKTCFTIERLKNAPEALKRKDFVEAEDCYRVLNLDHPNDPLILHNWVLCAGKWSSFSEMKIEDFRSRNLFPLLMGRVLEAQELSPDEYHGFYDTLFKLLEFINQYHENELVLKECRSEENRICEDIKRLKLDVNDSSVMEEWTEATFKTENYEKVGLKLKTEFGELLPEFIKMDRELFGDHLSS
ncbi:hypothetical protein SAMN02910264_01276 [Ruminococcaceae bacterium YAD3003]|nr:hypothetical protein SAMN02910264_01276 [Ruminococcaceae bacterium YAD3003]